MSPGFTKITYEMHHNSWTVGHAVGGSLSKTPHPTWKTTCQLVKAAWSTNLGCQCT